MATRLSSSNPPVRRRDLVRHDERSDTWELTMFSRGTRMMSTLASSRIAAGEVAVVFPSLDVWQILRRRRSACRHC